MALRLDDIPNKILELSNMNNICLCVKMKREVEKKILKEFKSNWKPIPKKAFINEMSDAINWARDLIKKFDAELIKDHDDYNKNLLQINNKIMI